MAQQIICCLMFLAVVPAKSQEMDLIVNIIGVRNEKGDVLVGLYNSDETFLRNKYKVVKTKAVKGHVFVTFYNVPFGEYGIAVIHDEDHNGKFNATWFGYPTEGFGFSNNARGTLGPPSFRKAKFTVHDPLSKNSGKLECSQSIDLKYM